MAKQAYTYQAADDLIRKWLGASILIATNSPSTTSLSPNAKPVNPSLYSKIKFGGLKGSNPLNDKINPSLLSDIDKAAKLAGVIVNVTTAITGHKNAGRHPSGNAVDIAIVNGKGWFNKSSAQRNGIYNEIILFVDKLKEMGYVLNNEYGNDKAVLTFDFPGHENHIHVSRKSA